MKNNTKRNHHYLPKFYLKYWANKENKVWVYELSPSNENQPNPSLVHIKKVCSEEYLYSIGESVAIEDWAGENIEPQCSQAFKKIEAKEKINDDDILYTKAFLALTIARHPVMKKSSKEVFNSIHQEIVPLNPLAQTVRLRMKANLIEFNKFNLQVLYISKDIDESFITSDVPFYWPIPDKIWFPISPKALAFLSKQNHLSVNDEINETSRIQKINLELALSARQIRIANKLNVFKLFP
jgi:hypothetical protein